MLQHDIDQDSFSIPTPTPSSLGPTDDVGRRITSDDDLFGLLQDIWAYRSRRHAMLHGTPVTGSDLADFSALERRLRGAPHDLDGAPSFLRFDCSVHAELSSGRGGRTVAVHVASLSADGAKIRHRTELPVGQSVVVRFTVAMADGRMTFEFPARVTWARDSVASIRYAGRPSRTSRVRTDTVACRRVYTVSRSNAGSSKGQMIRDWHASCCAA